MKKNLSHGRRREVYNYWQSYSDIMAALLLMFILIMSAILYRSSKLSEEKERHLDELREAYLEKNDQLKEKKQQLENLSHSLGIKKEIIEKLQKAFFQSGMKVQIDIKTGSITLPDSVLFETDSDELTDEGKKFLNSFAPKYIAVLLNEEVQNYISEIIIEGHADIRGGFLYNLELSQLRALAVASFLLDSDSSPLEKKQIKQLKKILTANGRSSSVPIYLCQPDGKICQQSSKNIDIKASYDASRRVVFLFRLKDEQMIEDILRILREVADK